MSQLKVFKPAYSRALGWFISTNKGFESKYLQLDGTLADSCQDGWIDTEELAIVAYNRYYRMNKNVIGGKIL